MNVFDTKKIKTLLLFERHLDIFECQVNNKQERICLRDSLQDLMYQKQEDAHSTIMLQQFFTTGPHNTTLCNILLQPAPAKLLAFKISGMAKLRHLHALMYLPSTEPKTIKARKLSTSTPMAFPTGLPRSLRQHCSCMDHGCPQLPTWA